VARGLMGSKVVEDNSKVQQELATMERKIQGLSEKLAEVKATRAQLENEVHALSARIGELEVAIPKMEMDIKVRITLLPALSFTFAHAPLPFFTA
jgi:septal ring factor EnvC (AmiA/AmiB activator)